MIRNNPADRIIPGEACGYAENGLDDLLWACAKGSNPSSSFSSVLPVVSVLNFSDL